MSATINAVSTAAPATVNNPLIIAITILTNATVLSPPFIKYTIASSTAKNIIPAIAYPPNNLSNPSHPIPKAFNPL